MAPTPGKRAWREQVIALGLAFAVLMTTSFLSAYLDARARREEAAPAPIFFPRADLLKPALLGFDAFAADVYWIRAVQYFGGRVERRANFPQLYQLVDMATSLDPHFVDAYVYGGLFLVIARQLPQAIAIYEKGIAANPAVWQLPHDLGRLYFLETREYDKALRWWQVADRLPGRPHYLPRFLIRLQAKTGHRETALELWQKMLEQSDNESIRAIAKREIETLLKELGQQTQGAPRS